MVEKLVEIFGSLVAVFVVFWLGYGLMGWRKGWYKQAK